MTDSASRNVARAIARALRECGSSVLFGVPGGGANLDMVGAAVDAGMQFVLTHGETPAAIMAGAYAELTGNPGACVVTRGPGAASAVNGAAQAQLDRQPLIVVTDSVSPSDASRISHQRLDQRTLYAPIAKRSIRIGDDRAEELAASAVELALAPPAGVVHVDVAPDDLSDPGAFAQPPTSSKAAVAEARELLARSEFPVLLIGVGARGAHEEIRRLIQHTACPVLTTYKAKGIIPESWPNACGLLTGATIEAPVIEAADLIVGIGLDPVELIAVPWSYKTPMVLLGEWYVGADYFGPALEVVGPLRDLLPLAGEAVTRGSGAAELRAGYLAQRRRLEARAAGLAPHDVVAAVRDVFEDAIVAIDAGAHMLVAMALWETERPGAVLISSGLATMGFALPAAIAAAIANPGRRVVCLIGDGGLGMTLGELEIVSRLTLPVTVVVFNDSALTLIELKQDEIAHGGTQAVRYQEIDFAAASSALGLPGRRVTTLDELESVLGSAGSGPLLIDAVVDPSGYGEVLEAIRGARTPA